MACPGYSGLPLTMYGGVRGSRLAPWERKFPRVKLQNIPIEWLRRNWRRACLGFSRHLQFPIELTRKCNLWLFIGLSDLRRGFFGTALATNPVPNPRFRYQLPGLKSALLFFLFPLRDNTLYICSKARINETSTAGFKRNGHPTFYRFTSN